MSGRARSSSSAGRARSSSGNGRSSNEDNTNHAIRIVRRKLRDSKIKVASIVHRCEVKDRNEDGLVHIDDLEDILNEVIPSKHRITRRELIRFSATIMSERNDGRIQYEKISDILEPKVKKVSEDENWVDIEDDEGDTKWATQPGRN
jgi:methyl coenzyme M reductase subunit D